jgi:DNA (cytosine-5)-methyltransferase 1
MPRRSAPVFIDLFAGCGGLSLGLEQAGFRPVLFCELNEHARATYRANRRRLIDATDDAFHLHEYSDIAELTNQVLSGHLARWRRAGLQEIDLVCGGPPCQGYSGIGHRRTHKVEREQIPSNHLYQEMIRVIEAVRPRLFLFENVRGILTGRWTKDDQKGSIWREVLGAFNALSNLGAEVTEGYHVRFAAVRAKQYGVPQNRPRVLIAGVRRDLIPTLGESGNAIEDGIIPRPLARCAPDLLQVLADLIDPSFRSGETTSTTVYPNAATTNFQKEMRLTPNGTLLPRGAPVSDHHYSRHSPQVRERFEYMLAHGGRKPKGYTTKKFAQRLLPARWSAAGPNITATSLPDDFVHFKQPRSLTVREWARLQCFPDWYVFHGPRTTGGLRRAGNPSLGDWEREVPKYTQIGNAVPVRLARAIGDHFKVLLKAVPKRNHRRKKGIIPEHQ